MEEKLIKKIVDGEYRTDLFQIKSVVEGDKVHFQTDPYWDDDHKLCVRRLGTVSLKIVKTNNIVVEEFSISQLKEIPVVKKWVSNFQI